MVDKLDEIQNNLTHILQTTEINISKSCKKAKLSRNTHHRLTKNKNEIGVPSGQRGITTLRIFLTIDDPFIFNA